jgi:hypothetical protein
LGMESLRNGTADAVCSTGDNSMFARKFHVVMLDTFNRSQRVTHADTMKASNFGPVPRSVLTSRVWSQKRTDIINQIENREQTTK